MLKTIFNRQKPDPMEERSLAEATLALRVRLDQMVRIKAAETSEGDNKPRYVFNNPLAAHAQAISDLAAGYSQAA
jgi:hypothetical protein